MAAEPPRRVRVTHPRTEAARRVTARPVAYEISEQTEIGAVYMSSLIRSQRRLAIIVCGAVATLLCGIALLGAFAPRMSHWHVFAVPFPWLLLGVLVYPVLIALAVFAVRQAERHEQDFVELVRREPSDF